MKVGQVLLLLGHSKESRADCAVDRLKDLTLFTRLLLGFYSIFQF